MSAGQKTPASAIRIKIAEADFDPGHEADILGKARDGDGFPGAVATFTGIARDNSNEIKAITLEHYPAMTENELERIVAEAASRWPLMAVTVIHRIGRLVAGERIVFVGCASRHRKAALEAVDFIMDFLKTDAPFWKSEETAEGTTQWVAADAKDTAAAARWSKDKA